VTSGPKPFDLGSTVPQSFDDTTLLADDSFTPSCGAFFGSIADNVYSFTAPQASTYSFDTFGSASTTFVSLRDSLACNELGCSNQRVIVSLGAGQRVLVIVDAFGDFTLNIADVGTPGCGNGVVEQKEQCDGHDFNGLDCFQATLGSLPFGTLSCTVGCTIDTSGCLSGGQDGGGGFGGFGGSAGFGASPGGFPGAGGAIVGDASIVGPPGPSP
jgi:hypothetical protein